MIEDIFKAIDKVMIEFGKSKKGEKKTRLPNGAGFVNNEIICEMVYEDYGLQISFVEANPDQMAVVFNDQLVLSTVDEGGYNPDDYSYVSPILRHVYNFDTLSCVEQIFVHGEWTELLLFIAENAEKIKAKKKQMEAETSAINSKKSELNDMMLKHLKFSFNYFDEGYYHDKVVYAEAINGAVTVYTMDGNGQPGEMVFCYITKLYLPGPWEDHINRLIEADIAKITPDAKKFGYDPRTLRDLKEIEKEQEAERIKNLPRETKYKSASEQLDALKRFI